MLCRIIVHIWLFKVSVRLRPTLVPGRGVLYINNYLGSTRNNERWWCGAVLWVGKTNIETTHCLRWIKNWIFLKSHFTVK